MDRIFLRTSKKWILKEYRSRTSTAKNAFVEYFSRTTKFKQVNFVNIIYHDSWSKTL